MHARKIYQANIITFTVIQSEEFGDYKCINYSGLLSFGEIPGDLHFALTANWFLSILYVVFFVLNSVDPLCTNFSTKVCSSHHFSWCCES